MFDDLLTKLKLKKPDSNISGENASESADGAEVTPDAVDDVDDAAKKKKSLIIRILVIAGLAYFGYTEFLEPPPPPPPVANKPRPKKLPKKEEQDKTAENKAVDDLKKTDEINKDAPKDDLTKKIQEKMVEQAPAVEEINITKKNTEKVPEVISIPEPQIVESDIDKKIDQLIDKEEKKEVVVMPVELPKEVKIEPKRTGEKKEIIKKSEPFNLKDKIVLEENYTEPPPYDILGRGLGYNCKDKYWSCMSKATFVQCNKNMKWNKTNQKPIECAVVSVYNSEEDCITVQQYNVATNQPTHFCN